MLNIITVPDPELRRISRPVTNLDQKTLVFIHALGDVLIKKNDPPGVGLSAIQVGRPLRLFYTYLPKNPQPKDKDWQPHNLELKVHINPKITHTSADITLGENPDKPVLEGCLSIPHLYGPVWRHRTVELAYQTLNPAGQITEETTSFSEFPARVIQHEFDHLEGILFTDYLRRQSPAKSFLPLGDIDQLYFEQDDELLPIKNPATLINW